MRTPTRHSSSFQNGCTVANKYMFSGVRSTFLSWQSNDVEEGVIFMCDSQDVDLTPLDIYMDIHYGR
jgi:hypothetical protein